MNGYCPPIILGILLVAVGITMIKKALVAKP